MGTRCRGMYEYQLIFEVLAHGSTHRLARDLEVAASERAHQIAYSKRVRDFFEVILATWYRGKLLSHTNLVEITSECWFKGLTNQDLDNVSVHSGRALTQQPIRSQRCIIICLEYIWSLNQVGREGGRMRLV